MTCPQFSDGRCQWNSNGLMQYRAVILFGAEMVLADKDKDDKEPCSSSQPKRNDIVPFHKRRDQYISPRLGLNDFLSPRSSTLPASTVPSGGSFSCLDRGKKASRITRPLLTRKKERSTESAVLQDSLRSRFMSNLEKNLEDNDPDDIWTYHRCREFQAKDPLERRLLEQGITPVYDPEYKETPCYRELVPDILDLRVFLVSPGPKVGGHFQCHIYRKHEANKIYSRYKLCLSDGDHFLLSARKRKKSKTSNYAVSIDETDISNKTGNYFGKLRSNFLGTEFLLYDKGERPSYEIGCCLSPTNIRTELGGVIYQRNVFGGPRRMTAVIPSTSEDHKPHVFQPLLKGSSTILQKYKTGLDLDKMVVLRNKTPKWSPETQPYCLNFNASDSKRNFQLVSETIQDAVVLQFRKVAQNLYTMDYKYPLSPFQAFAICLSSLDNR